MLNCLHIFCKDCIQSWFAEEWKAKDMKTVTCPKCRTDVCCLAPCGHPASLLKLPPANLDVEWPRFLEALEERRRTCTFCAENPGWACKKNALNRLSDLLQSFTSDYKPSEEEIQRQLEDDKNEWSTWIKSGREKLVEVMGPSRGLLSRTSGAP